MNIENGLIGKTLQEGKDLERVGGGLAGGWGGRQTGCLFFSSHNPRASEISLKCLGSIVILYWEDSGQQWNEKVAKNGGLVKTSHQGED